MSDTSPPIVEDSPPPRPPPPPPTQRTRASLAYLASDFVFLCPVYFFVEAERLPDGRAPCSTTGDLSQRVHKTRPGRDTH
jgi:hypothetical protein